jgi:adenine-specific DNA-methyltransferase
MPGLLCYAPVSKPEKSVQIETTKNKVFIGDNLHAMEFLLKDYEGKIDLIVADPPYGMSNADKNFLDYFPTSQIWMSFMRPRLELARRLLAEDGKIIVNMGNERIHWLRLIMGEIFGEEQFLNNVIWSFGAISRHRPYRLRGSYENLVCFAKDFRMARVNAAPEVKLKFRNVINTVRRLSHHLGFPLQAGFDALGIKADPNTGEYYEMYTIEKMDFYSAPASDIWYDVGPINRMDSYYVPAMSQKPVKLLKKVINTFLTNKANGIVLDIFAGTGTTAHAIVELNSEDGGTRSFILIQSAEPCLEPSVIKRGYRLVSDILLDRLKRVATEFEKFPIDAGFAVYEMLPLSENNLQNSGFDPPT